MPKVSVIVPIYNVEQYIERCVRSLYEQTLEDIEYIFVDDSSPDNSVEILMGIMKEYPSRKIQSRIIHHNQNLGVSCSRIDGMKAASGEYVIHCDTDDWLDLNLYEKMYEQAKESDADIVVCDFLNEYSNGGNPIKTISSICGTPKQMLANMYKESFFCMLWRSMIRSELIEQYNLYTIPHVDMWEDVYVTLRAYYYANRVVKIDDSVYHYFVHKQSLTAHGTKSKFYEDRKAIVALLETFFKDKYDVDFKISLAFWKILAKSHMLTNANFEPNKWKNDFKEAHSFILKMHAIPWRTRLMYKITSISTLPIRLIRGR